MRRWRCGCGRGASTSWSGRSTCSARARRCGPRSRAAVRTARSSTGRPARGRRRWRGSRRPGAEGAFEEESAVNAGRAEIRAVIERARERRRGSGRATILFLDEIHRFNKAQQDALLPAVEEGLLTLIGATTENPYFEVNSALLSRCQVYELQPLEPRAGRGAAAPGAGGPRARASPTRRAVEDAALEMLAHRSGGDARVALSALERAVERAGGEPVDVAAAEDALQRKAVDYDREGDRHYDFISAWIKATRGSDVDASLYYLAAMLEGGEDPRFIARRMVILASEDVGNADPQALLDRRCGGPRGRPGRPAGVRAQPRPGDRLPGAGAEVERLLQGARGGPRRGPRERRQDAPRPSAGRPLSRAPGSWVAARATATRTTSRAASATSRCCHRASRSDRFYAPTDRGFEQELGRRLEELRKRLGKS